VNPIHDRNSQLDADNPNTVVRATQLEKPQCLKFQAIQSGFRPADMAIME